MVGAGILIHSVFLPPDTLVQTLRIPNPAPYILIESNSLNRISARQTISVEGGASGVVYSTNGKSATPKPTPANSTEAVIAWGRRADVFGYVGGMSYDTVSAVGQSGRLTYKHTQGTEISSPNPFGSDMWIEEVQGLGVVQTDVTLPQGSVLLIATDGTLPAPKSITVTWRMEIDNTVPRNLFYGGLALAVAGGALFFIGWWSERRQRRHRQGRMPRRPKPPRWRPSRRRELPAKTRRGRHALGFVATAVLVPTFLSGCSLVPSIVSDPEPTVRPPSRSIAMTAEQFDAVLADITATLAKADEQKAHQIAADRVGGPALRFRSAQYTIQKVAKSLVKPFSIPDGTVRLFLPQRTSEWPRSVLAVIDDDTNEKAPSVAVILTQSSARDNYRMVYAVALEPGARIPSVAAADQGASVLYGETTLLAYTPQQVAEAYGKLLLKGKQSATAGMFESDSLQQQIGAKAKEKRANQLGDTAKFTWKESVTRDNPIVFATTDASALVAVTVAESEIVTPAKSGSAITATGAVEAILGSATSMKGISAEYQYQLLFYVPALGSTEKVRLLGYSYALTSAKKLN